MHRLIYAIVEAPTRAEGFATGQAVLDRLVDSDATDFDYYVTFDKGTKTTGENRWGDLPTVAALDSAAGKQLLERGWQTTLDLDAYPVDQNGNERSYFGSVLFDQHGNGIRTRDQIETLRTEREQQWIVPADVHF